jgi:hypothetical protein
METDRRCSFYRSSRTPGMRHRVGHCEFDSTYSICDGDVKNCAKLNVLRRYLMERGWMKAPRERKKSPRT